MADSEPIKVVSILQQIGVPNKNGRVYTEECVRKALERYTAVVATGKMVTGGILGTLDPELSVVPRDPLLSEVSHVVNNLSIVKHDDCSELVGVPVVLDTPRGRELSALLASGVEIEYRPLFTASPDSLLLKDGVIIITECTLTSIGAFQKPPRRSN